MIAQAHSATLIGIEAIPIVVEVDLQGYIQGDPERSFILVGLPDKAVQESKERVRTACRNSGLGNPCTRSSTCAVRLPKRGILLLMCRFPKYDFLDDKAQEFVSQARSVFERTLPPLNGSFFTKDHLFIGETDHLFGLTWQQVDEKREAAIFTDLGLLNTPDLAYLLPAYLIAGVDYGETDLPAVLIDIFTPHEIQFKSDLKQQLSPPQQDVVCAFIHIWIDKHKAESSLVGAGSPFREFEDGYAVGLVRKLERAANYWRST